MRFNNQTAFKGHNIMNIVDKPVLHKKGKRWITIGLSALMLAGFGALSTGTLNVNADTTKAPTEQPAKQSSQPSNNNTTTAPTTKTTPQKTNNEPNQSTKASGTSTNASKNPNVVPQNQATSGSNSNASGSASATPSANSNVVSVSSENASSSANSMSNAIANLSNEVNKDSASVANLANSSKQSNTTLSNRLDADMAKLSQTNLKDANSLPNFNNDVININTDANKPKVSNPNKVTKFNKAPKKLQFKPYYVYSPTNIILHGRHGNLKISKQRGFTGKILRATKLNKKRAFVVEWNNKDYVVDAKQVRNVYIQPSEFNKVSRGVIPHATVLLTKDVNVYNSVHYTKRTVQGLFKRGSKLTVVGTKSFGEKGYKRTRLVLSNGLIITANKNFVQLLK